MKKEENTPAEELENETPTENGEDTPTEATEESGAVLPSEDEPNEPSEEGEAPTEENSSDEPEEPSEPSENGENPKLDRIDDPARHERPKFGKFGLDNGIGLSFKKFGGTLEMFGHKFSKRTASKKNPFIPATENGFNKLMATGEFEKVEINADDYEVSDDNQIVKK